VREDKEGRLVDFFLGSLFLWFLGLFGASSAGCLVKT